MAKLEALDDAEEFVNVLYYGEPGSGKTTAAASMAKLGRIVYIDAEAGLKVQPMKRLQIPTDQIMRYRVETFDDLQNLYWQLKAKLEEEPGAFAGVVFDSMTEIQKKLLEGITNARYQKSVAQAQRGGFEVKDDPFDTDRDEWGKMTEMCRRVCRQFRDLECHTAFVCLDKRDVDKEGDGGVFYRPALTPAFATDLQGYVDIVLHMSQEEVSDLSDYSRFVGLSVPVGKYRGKDRYGVLPPSMANPTFDRVVDFVRNVDALSPEVSWLEDPYVRQRMIRIGELPDPNSAPVDTGV
jgi:hypothetical protein